MIASEFHPPVHGDITIVVSFLQAKLKRRFTNVMRGQEPLQVFLRVRPILNEELEAGK